VTYGARKFGSDHGAGHPLLLLCDAKARNLRDNKAFRNLDHYFEWPKVAEAVIEAEKSAGKNQTVQVHRATY
jgi:hypothetical protein